MGSQYKFANTVWLYRLWLFFIKVKASKAKKEKIKIKIKKIIKDSLNGCHNSSQRFDCVNAF